MKRDLRHYASQTTVRLIVGALLLLFIVGDGLIGYFYGWAAAITGLLCMVGALVPIGLVMLVMGGLDWIVKKLDRD
jgi:magnesium-transporting ATPase (P-type)